MNLPTQDYEAVYGRMLQVWRVQTYVQLAQKLGIKPGTLRDSKSERRLPDEYIWRTMLGTGCTEQWLRMGVGPMLRGTLLVADLPDPLRLAIGLVIQEPTHVQESLRRAAQLLTSSDGPAWIDLFERLMVRYAEGSELGSALRQDVPPRRRG